MKFEIFKSAKNAKYYFNLKARNGKIILASQGYKSKAGAVSGAKSVQNNCTKEGRFVRKAAKNGKHHFNLLAANKQVIGSSQMYASTASMENGIRSVRAVAPNADIVTL